MRISNDLRSGIINVLIHQSYIPIICTNLLDNLTPQFRTLQDNRLIQTCDLPATPTSNFKRGTCIRFDNFFIIIFFIKCFSAIIPDSPVSFGHEHAAGQITKQKNIKTLANDTVLQRAQICQ
ncbi:hypothetical protein D1872_232820 [compost metagenome]